MSKKTKSSTSSNHYIDNATFYKALCEYKKLTNEAKAKGLTKQSPKWPRVPEYIGDCFVKIAQHLSYKPNFSGYTYKDEMISDGIENCLLYVDNFDTDNFKNPFAYFTQIIFFAFIRRIEKEKKVLMTKYKYIEHLDLSDLVVQSQDEGEYGNQYIEYLKTELDKVDVSAREPKKKRGKKTKVDQATIDSV